MAQYEKTAEILSLSEICPGIFDLVLKAPALAGTAAPGQFVNVYLNDSSRLLPRPLSLCGFDAAAGTLRIVFRVTGKGTGTELLSAMRPGEKLTMLGPLGNGFPTEGLQGPVYVVGGGIGLPPVLGWLQHSGVKGTAVLGYRDSRTFLLPEFKQAAEEVCVVTDDGSAGIHGTVIDGLLALEQEGKRPGTILACGPKPMLKALKEYAEKRGIVLWVSMEERMACGVGVCLGCVTPTPETDAHSNVNNKRVCKDGPVFRAEEVIL